MGLTNPLSFELVQHIDIYDAQVHSGEVDEAVEVDSEAVQCGATHPLYPMLYACAAGSTIFLIDLRTGKQHLRIPLRNLGVISDLVFLTPIKRVIYRTALNDDTIVREKVALYNPNFCETFIAFTVRSMPTQASMVFLLDLEANSLYRLGTRSPVCGLAVPLAGVSHRILCSSDAYTRAASNTSDISEAFSPRAYQIEPRSSVPYMVLAIALQSQVIVVTFTVPKPGARLGNMYKLLLQLPPHNTPRPEIAFGGSPRELYVRLDDSLMRYDMGTCGEREEWNRATSEAAAYRELLLQQLQRNGLHSYGVEYFAAYTFVVESMFLPFSQAQAVSWSFRDVIRGAQAKFSAHPFVARQLSLTDSHQFGVERMAVSPLGELIALATRGFIILYHSSKKQIFAILLYPTTHSSQYVDSAKIAEFTLRFMLTEDQGLGKPDVGNIDDFADFFFGDEEPGLKGTPVEPEIPSKPVLNQDVLRQLHASSYLSQSSLLSEISYTAATVGSEQDGAGQTPSGCDPLAYFLNESTVSSYFNGTLQRSMRLLEFLQDHKHMYSIFYSLFEVHTRLGARTEMHQALQGAQKANPVSLLSENTVTMDLRDVIDFAAGQTFCFSPDNALLTLSSLNGTGSPVVWDLPPFESHHVAVVQGRFWTCEFIGNYDLSASNVCSFCSDAWLVMRSLGSQLHILSAPIARSK
ncbi:hypothetical protein GMRT_10588 [Giardia muris]|uniref:Uncharacterized protein n=1 Tax=Giardia muris TaxID=5742 RepID=A0A4Z1SYT9_GIAMU|nr:hypothetical protein GMRT_10588 [Giardia muris]|eukprot:TNJ26833.1 hypothetical protein GMRT_10588 [Giardia muris]